ncbi:hypothetical protein [Psychroflexus salis]|uniref:Uncharacterized protein n=1 Tax=Psychroflexus salis TaxID=1526574 RepID=A0A916ZPW8_9FLAO|nr:hypothetical protein [Psychroflexus salis]GGE08447.1 hypothetical protein GCM10010831_07490 [Psychroflexus salis]
MKTINYSIFKKNLLEEIIDELSPEFRPALSFEDLKQKTESKLNETKLLELFGIRATVEKSS